MLTELTAALHARPDLRHDAYCQRTFLSILAKGAAVRAFDANNTAVKAVDPEMVWAMATETPGALKQQYDPSNLTNALRWQIESGQLNSWADRVLFAAGTRPDVLSFQRLPVQLWQKHGVNAVGVLLDLLEKAASCPHLLAQDGEPWVVKAFEPLPGAFFFTEPVPEAVAAWVTSHMSGDLETNRRAQAIARMFLEGLVKGQLEMWGEPSLCQERTTFAVIWIAAHLPEEFLPDRWAQWLGSQRGQCEDAIVRRLRASVEQLHRDLLDSREQGREAWLKHLTEFFTALRGAGSDADEEGALSPGGEIVLTFCTAAVANYHPAAPDPDYWSKLNALVERWKAHIPLAEIPRVMHRAWMQLHLRLEAMIAQRVIDVTMPALHDFKAHMADPRGSADIPPYWLERFSKIIDRTMQYLDGHRWAESTLVDLRTVLEEVAYHPPFTSGERGVAPHTPRLWAVRPAQPVMINGDRKLLAEVVRALLDNARRHTPLKAQGGWIWAEIRQERGSAVLEITDHGSGDVSSATLERLNDAMGKPFSGGNSTGYGTRHCHQIVRLHQGSLQFRHAPRGVTAEIRLPLADEEG